MMYSFLPLPLVAAAFVGGYWTNAPAPPPARAAPDLAAPAQAAMASDESEPVILEPEIMGSHYIQRASDGLFYVRAQVNGRPVRFLVDTGATVVVLSASDARAVGAAPAATSYHGRMVTAGGSRPMAWTRLGHVRVAGREVRGVRAAVVSGGSGVSLLGQNVLAKLGAVRIDGDRMEFETGAKVY